MAQSEITIGKCKIPSELFERYLRLIKSTERSSERYNYEFDQLRQTTHQEIIDCVGLMIHTEDYRHFQLVLQDLCEEMLPDRFPKIEITKTTAPTKGLLNRD